MQARPPKKPELQKIRHRLASPFGQVFDDYFWVRSDDRWDPRVLDYLRQENDYTDSLLQHTIELQDQLYDDMAKRVPAIEETAGFVSNGFRYFKRRQPGDQYWRWYRIKAAETDTSASPELVLDENEEAEDWIYFDVGSVSVSPDGRLVAFTVDTHGDESYKLFVRTVGEQADRSMPLEPIVSDTASSVEWANDSHTLFYLRRPTAQDGWRLGQCTLLEPLRLDSSQGPRLGWHVSEEVVLFTGGDEESAMSMHKTSSLSHLLVGFEGGEYALDLSAPTPRTTSTADSLQPGWRAVAPESDERDYLAVENWGDSWLLLADSDEHPDGQLLAAHSSDVSRYTVLMEAGEGQEVESFQVTQRHLAVLSREGDSAVLRAFALPADDRQPLPDQPLPLLWQTQLDSAAVAVHLEPPPEGWQARRLRYSTSSLVAPERLLEVDLDTLQESTVHVEVVEGGFDEGDYCTTSIHATSHDGTQVPITVAHHRTRFRRDGTHPLILYGYGAYGNKQRPHFNPAELCMLDHGWGVAIAHVRGGGERGASWHRAGKCLRKPNTFHDFVAAAEHLVQERYSSRGLLAAWGRSAGGLTVAAALNMAPGLFGAAVLDVPFVDVLGSMLDPDLPMTIRERPEWGDPLDDEEEYRCIASYSPYHNLKQQPYPHMLITAGLHDQRVPYWGPAKYAARVRELRTDGGMTLLRTDMSSGHFASSGASDRLSDRALKCAFLMHALGRIP